MARQAKQSNPLSMSAQLNKLPEFKFIPASEVSAINEAASGFNTAKSALYASIGHLAALWRDEYVKAGKPADWLKGNARTNERKAAIASLFQWIGEKVGLGESAMRNYPTAFWLAVQTGNPFTLDASAGKDKATGKGKAKGPGKAVVKNDEDALKLLNQAIEIWQALKDPIAAELVELRDSYYTDGDE